MLLSSDGTAWYPVHPRTSVEQDAGFGDILLSWVKPFIGPKDTEEVAVIESDYAQGAATPWNCRKLVVTDNI